jgi:hypothetical protein
LVTFVTFSTRDMDLSFSDDDGPGPANPAIVVYAADGETYQWDRDSNLEFEGVEGGSVSYFAGGLGLEFDIDMHRFADSLVRTRVIGSIQCPPDPFASLR